MSDPLCPFCGAYSTRQCELEEEMPGCSCPWEDQLADEREQDPDLLREDRDERRNLDRDWFERSNLDD